MKLVSWVQGKWKSWMRRNCLPGDYKERMRVKAFVLGAGCPASREGEIEVEDGNKNL